MAVAYSYIRFSSKRQELGDSLRRQLERAEQYAARHNLTLDTKSYRDLGISAFRGENAATGYLKAFLDAVKQGVIAKDSYLLVESLDRLSRGKVLDSRQIFTDIINSGITLVTFQPEQAFTREIIDNDWTKLIGIDVLMARAHEESETKSDRVTKAWTAKRKTGKVLTARAPAWLTLKDKNATDPAKRWTVDPDKVKVIKLIFKLAVAGHGTPTIARKLNAAGYVTFELGKRWLFNSVGLVIKNPAVFGRFTSTTKGVDPIDGYYSVIVSESTFHTANANRKQRAELWNRTGSTQRPNLADGSRPPKLMPAPRKNQFAKRPTRSLNLFARLAYCKACGSALRITGSSGKHSTLRCAAADAGTGCKQRSFSYLPAERTVLAWLGTELAEKVRAAEVMPDDPMLSLKLERAELQAKIETLLDDLELKKDVLQVRQRISKHQARINKMTAEINASVPPALEHETVIAAAEILANLYVTDKLDKLTSDERVTVRTAVRQLVDRLEFWTDAAGDKMVSFTTVGFDETFELQIR